MSTSVLERTDQTIDDEPGVATTLASATRNALDEVLRNDDDLSFLSFDAPHSRRLVTAIIASLSPDVATLHAFFEDSPYADTDLVLPVSEFYPDLTWQKGETHVVEVLNDDARPMVSLTRPSLVALLLESVSPEARDGLVRFMGAVRQPGVRSKVAVAATREDVDPVAAIVGHGARRVEQIRRALGGERVDVVLYDSDAVQFLKNAFAPAHVTRIEVIPEKSAARVYVPKHQIPAAVGSGGLNATLAGRLCGFRVTVVPVSE